MHAAAAAAPAMGGSFGSNDDLLNFVIPPPTLSGSGAGSAADFDDPNFVKKDIEKMMETSPAAKEERAATVKTICDSYSTNKNESLANFNDLDIDTLINYITLVGDDLN